jgi:hypothetical protein
MHAVRLRPAVNVLGLVRCLGASLPSTAGVYIVIAPSPAGDAKQANKHQIDAGKPQIRLPHSYPRSVLHPNAGKPVLLHYRTRHPLTAIGPLIPCPPARSKRRLLPRLKLRLCTQSCSATRISTLITGHASPPAPTAAPCLWCSTAAFDR